MISFFRRIRHALLESGLIRKYLIYAAGEIVLVVTGILIALQLNNWNQNRVQQSQFEQSMEQIYNALKTEVEWMNVAIFNSEGQIAFIDALLSSPDKVPGDELIHHLWYLDYYSQIFVNEVEYLVESLVINPNNYVQKDLANQVASYTSNELWDTQSRMNQRLLSPIIGPLLETHLIPRPVLSFNLHYTQYIEEMDLDFFSPEEIVRAQALLQEPFFQVALRSLKSQKDGHFVAMINRRNDARSIIQLIRNHFPTVRLLYDDLGIIGDALTTGWDQSVRMTLIDEEASIWEIRIELDEGSIKFRNRNSWNQNWGGASFPAGNTIYFGQNIRVKPGIYKITLNLTEDHYDFVLVEDLEY